MFGIDEGISPNSAILSFFLVSCHLRFCYPAISSEFELAQTFSQLDMTTCVNASFEKVLSKFESNVTESIDFFLSIHTSKVTYHCEHFLKSKSTSFL